MRSELDENLKKAIKSQEKQRVATLRLINAAIKELRDNDIAILSEDAKVGAEGYKIVFIHPKSTGGVLVELAEKP
mgnify:CR=1 FL=1